MEMHSLGMALCTERLVCLFGHKVHISNQNISSDATCMSVGPSGHSGVGIQLLRAWRKKLRKLRNFPPTDIQQLNHTLNEVINSQANPWQAPHPRGGVGRAVH